MSKRIIYTLFAVSIGLNLGMIGMTVMNRTAPPGPPPPGPGPGPGGPPDPELIVEDHVVNITRHLELDEDQSRAIREIMEEHVLTLIQLREQAEIANEGLSETFAAPVFDPEGFRQRTAEASRARSRVDSLAALLLIDEAEVLTPEQRRRFAEVASRIHSQPAGPRPQGGPPPGGGRPDDRPPPR